MEMSSIILKTYPAFLNNADGNVKLSMNLQQIFVKNLHTI